MLEVIANIIIFCFKVDEKTKENARNSDGKNMKTSGKEEKKVV
jgi:hypothetical protein